MPVVESVGAGVCISRCPHGTCALARTRLVHSVLFLFGLAGKPYPYFERIVARPEVVQRGQASGEPGVASNGNHHGGVARPSRFGRWYGRLRKSGGSYSENIRKEVNPKHLIA